MTWSQPGGTGRAFGSSSYVVSALFASKLMPNISVGINGIWGSPLTNRCKNEAIFLMFDKEERRRRKRKEIHVIVLGDGW
jgi:hypothetical protein